TTVKSGWVASSAPYPARTTSWSSTTTIRTGSAMPGPGDMLSPGQRQHRLDQEAADRRRPGPQLPADHGGAFPHADQAVPAAPLLPATRTTVAGTAGTEPSAAGAAAGRTTSAGATGAGAAVPDPQPQRVPAVVQLHIDRRARGVPAGVGERLLHDAVRGELDAGRQRHHVALQDQPGTAAGRGAGLVDQLVELRQAGLRGPGRLGPGVLPEHAQQPAHLG